MMTAKFGILMELKTLKSIFSSANKGLHYRYLICGVLVKHFQDPETRPDVLP